MTYRDWQPTWLVLGTRRRHEHERLVPFREVVESSSARFAMEVARAKLRAQGYEHVIVTSAQRHWSDR